MLCVDGEDEVVVRRLSLGEKSVWGGEEGSFHVLWVSSL